MTQHECTVYKCGHCRRHYLVKHACEKHEKYCPKNPANWHACSTCPHLEKDKEDVGDEYSSRSYTQTTFRCVIQDKYMHSYVAERKGHSCIGDTERMPLEGECLDHPDAIYLADKIARVLLDESPLINTIDYTGFK